MKGIVCSYSLELGVVNGLANFPKGHSGKVQANRLLKRIQIKPMNGEFDSSDTSVPVLSECSSQARALASLRVPPPVTRVHQFPYSLQPP